jgi:hypothetical protein
MTQGELITEMIDRNRHRRFVAAQLLIGTLLTLLLTYLSLAIADHVGTPEFVRCIFSPGYVLGVRFATGCGFLETLGSFGRIAITVNMIYFGMICFLLLWKINWPQLPTNPRHRFWMEP